MGVSKDLWTEGVARYNSHDWEGLASLYASDAVHVDPLGRHEGPAGIQAYFAEATSAFPDMRMETSRLLQEGDTIVAEWTWRATNTGPLSMLTMPDGTEIPATGKTAEVPGVSVLTVGDGKVANQRDYYDSASMMSQLGLMPGT
jgi:steroid delta-isomerase-like uncharacterized protein